MGNVVLRWLGKRIAAYLTKEIPGYEPSTSPDYASLERSIQPGDVLLIRAASAALFFAGFRLHGRAQKVSASSGYRALMSRFRPPEYLKAYRFGWVRFTFGPKPA